MNTAAGRWRRPGRDVLANPEPRAKAAKPVVDMVASVVPFAPSDPMVPTTIAGHARLSPMEHLGGVARLFSV